MTPEEIAKMQDGMDQILEVVAGYRSKAEAAGFSPTAAESFAIDLHRQIMGQKKSSSSEDD